MISTPLTLVTCTSHLNPLPFRQGERRLKRWHRTDNNRPRRPTDNLVSTTDRLGQKFFFRCVFIRDLIVRTDDESCEYARWPHHKS